MELNTPQEAQAYLATIAPGPHDLYPFEMGWVCTPRFGPGELTPSQMLGLARLVIDSQTGVVTEHPSLSPPMIAEAYVEAKRSGQPAGHQIYPPQWRIALRRTREDPETIEYLMTAVSLTEPPEPTVEHPITVDKASQLTEPPDNLSVVAASQAIWVSQQNQGAWPERATTEF